MVKTPEKIICPHCGRQVDPRHPRMCPQNPARLLPVREVNPSIIQDSRTEIQEGIESLGAVSSAMGSDRSLELNKDVKIAELESERWANSLSPTQLRAFASRIKRDELLEKADASIMQPGDGDNMFAGLAKEMRQIDNDRVRNIIIMKKLKERGYVEDNGHKKEGDIPTLREMYFMKLLGQNDSQGKVNELQRRNDRLEIENQLKLLGIQIQNLANAKPQDLPSQLEAMKKTYDALTSFFGEKEKQGENWGDIISKVALPVLTNPAIQQNVIQPALTKLGNRLGDRIDNFQIPRRITREEYESLSPAEQAKYAPYPQLKPISEQEYHALPPEARAQYYPPGEPGEQPEPEFDIVEDFENSFLPGVPILRKVPRAPAN